MKKWTKFANRPTAGVQDGRGLTARFALGAVLLVVMSLARTPPAHADTMLMASTELVSGTSAATFSFNAPGSGTVTAQVSTLAWPVPLSALSFSATTATDTLDSWSSSAPTSTPYVGTFQVGAGTYFAHVMATAGGSLDLGLYSMMLTFTPSAVPLPAPAGMLIIGLLVFYGLRKTIRVGPPLESNRLLGA
jgi:hypothetical protein